jgi:hypothetical protein
MINEKLSISNIRWTRKKSDSAHYRHSRENGNPVNSNTSGLLLEFIPMQIGAGVTD